MIRAATALDIPAMIGIGREMHAESWYAYLPFDEVKLTATLLRLIDGSGFLEVYERNGEISGGMAGICAEMWFCRARIASDLALFVLPGKRGSIAAVRLLERFVQWARWQGASEVNLGVSTNVRKDETGRLYEALGFSHVGGIYKLRIT